MFRRQAGGGYGELLGSLALRWDPRWLMQIFVGRAMLFFFPWILVALPCLAQVERVSVSHTLEKLANEGGFVVTGLDKTQDAYGRDEGEAIYPRLRGLLNDFNHVIVQSPDGSVSKVIIIGRKTAWVAPQPTPAKASEEAPAEGDPAAKEQPSAEDVVVNTERRGASHLVSASLEGAGGKRIAQSLTVDTGADFVTLPTSALGSLGIQANQLVTREVQTANGKISARLGRLAAVWFGEHKIADVQVAFIDDAKLGGNGLLGMSVLSRYRMTIDDEANRLVLAPK